MTEREKMIETAINNYDGMPKEYDLAVEDNQEEVKPLWLPFTEIKAKEQRFLFPGIPWNNITLIVSDGGLGKSFISANLAAAVSTGTASIFGHNGLERPARVILINAEDSNESVNVKRLMQAKAYMTLIETADETQATPTIEEIAYRIEEVRPHLVILDPLQSFVPEKAAMERRNVMRKIIEPLQKAAASCNCAVVIVMHTNKRFGASGRARVADSADMWDIARSVFIIGDTHDGENTRYISHEKSNYGRQLPTILYQIDDNGLRKVGESDLKDYDYIHEQYKQPGGRPPAQRSDAERIILEALEFAKDNELTGKQLAAIAEDNGISDRTFKRAKNHLVETEQVDRRRFGQGKAHTIIYHLME